MTRAELLALAERVENAAGPDRELDAQVALAAGVVPEGAFRPCASPDPGMFSMGGYTHWVAPNYTISIDTAASLMPPGWWAEVRVGFYNGGPQTSVTCAKGTGKLVRGGAKDEPRARLAAALRALASETEET